MYLDLYYTPDHTWGKVEPDGNIVVGFDDFAQKMAGEVRRVRLFPPGKEVQQFSPFGTVETAKWTGKLVAPLSGKIVAANEEIVKNPRLVNDDPYGKGWMIVIEPSNLEEELKCLLHGDAAVERLKKDIMEIAKEKI